MKLKTYPSWIDGTQGDASTPRIGLKWFNSESVSSATKRSVVSVSFKVPVNHTVKNIYNSLH